VLGLRRSCRELHERRPPILLRLRRYIIWTTPAFFLLNILRPYLSRQELPLHLLPVVARGTCSSKLWCSLSPGRSSSLQAPSHPHQTPGLTRAQHLHFLALLALAPIKASDSPLPLLPLAVAVKPQEPFFLTLDF
jgi:hypothetical protein